MIKVLFSTEHAVYGKTYKDEYEMRNDLIRNDFIVVDKETENKFSLLPKDKIIVIRVLIEEGEKING